MLTTAGDQPRGRTGNDALREAPDAAAEGGPGPGADPGPGPGPVIVRTASGRPGRTEPAAVPATTVLFATRNRAEMLAEVLDCFARLEAPDGGWKLIVVDNGSSDATAELLAARAARLPLTALSEPRAGKNRALNAALPHLSGDLVVLTDDDVLPRPDWLRQLRRASLEHPETTLFGGTVLPHWSTTRPAWLTERSVPFSVLYAQQMRGDGPCSCDAIFGPNMAVRRAVFESGFRFAEHVGPDESRRLYAMGGETEFLRRLEAAGYGGRFVAEATVGHIIRPQQIEEGWILERAYRYGFGEGRHYATRDGQGRPVGFAKLRLRALAYGLLAAVLGPLPASPGRLRIRYRSRSLAGTLAALRDARTALRDARTVPSERAADAAADRRHGSGEAAFQRCGGSDR